MNGATEDGHFRLSKETWLGIRMDFLLLMATGLVAITLQYTDLRSDIAHTQANIDEALVVAEANRDSILEINRGNLINRLTSRIDANETEMRTLARYLMNDPQNQLAADQKDYLSRQNTKLEKQIGCLKGAKTNEGFNHCQTLE